MSRALIISFLFSALSGFVLAGTNSTSSNSTVLETKGNPDAKAFSWKGDTWDNDFGAWSSFHIRVGSSQVNARVFPSTKWQEILVILPQACEAADNGTWDSPCASSRGGTVKVTNSTTLIDEGLFDISLDNDLGFKGSGMYGFDEVGLDVSGSAGPVLNNQTLAGIINPSIPVGIFGINDGYTNFSDYDNPKPGYLTSLWDEGLIPSKSFGFFAGAIYRLKAGVLGRLVFGGYDSAAIVENNITFTQTWDSVDEYRHLVVSVQSIEVNTSAIPSASAIFPAKNTTTLKTLPASKVASVSAPDLPYYARIDSSTPFIWLPNNTLARLVAFYGLSFDKNASLYYFPHTKAGDKMYAAAQSTTFNFRLANGPDDELLDTVNITFPFAAFDLAASAAIAGKKTLDKRYVPFKGANVESYTLGRSFLQEAYVFADFNRKTFNLYQAAFPADGKEKITEVRAPADDYIPKKPTPHRPGVSTNSEDTPTPSKPRKRMSTVQLAGLIAVGVLAATLLLIVVLLYARRKRRQRLVRELQEKDFVPELHGNAEWNEMHGEPALRELPATDSGSPIRRSKILPINSEVLELSGEDCTPVLRRLTPPAGSSSSSTDRSSTGSSQSPQDDMVSPEDEADVGRWDHNEVVSPQDDGGERGWSWSAYDTWRAQEEAREARARQEEEDEYSDIEEEEEDLPSGEWQPQVPVPARVHDALQQDERRGAYIEYVHPNFGPARSMTSLDTSDYEDDGMRNSMSWRPR